MPKTTHDKFPGFPTTLEKSFWQFPSIINGHVHSLSGAEFKVLWYILRHTFGWQKEHDKISITQICNGITKRNGEVVDRGTGLSRKWAITSLSSLEEKGFIVVDHQPGKTSWIAPRLTSSTKYTSVESTPVTDVESTLVTSVESTPTINNSTIDNSNINITARSSKQNVTTSCPNPLGHKDCTSSIDSIQLAFSKKFVNYPKQIKAYHQIIKAGFTADQIEVTLNSMDNDKFWKNAGWDLMNVANEIGKGGQRYA